MATNKTLRRERIKKGIRGKVSGTAERPRLAVFRSNKNISVQAIDDVNGVTIASSSSKGADVAAKADQAKNVGTVIAKELQEKGISTVTFDRGGYLYHGRVKALAEGAREGGLKF